MAKDLAYYDYEASINDEDADIQSYKDKNSDIVLINGIPSNPKQVIFDEKCSLFSYDEEENFKFFNVCKDIFANRQEKYKKRIFLSEVLDFIHIKVANRPSNDRSNKLYWEPDEEIDFNIIKVEDIYNYPVEKEGYVLDFNVVHMKPFF